MNIIYLKELCPEATWGGGSIKLHSWIGGQQWQLEVNSKQIKLVKEAQPVPLLNLHVNTNGLADYCHGNEWCKHTSCCFYIDQWGTLTCFYFILQNALQHLIQNSLYSLIVHLIKCKCKNIIPEWPVNCNYWP